MIYRHNRLNKKILEPPKTVFYIIRHGQTPLNVNDEIRSWLDIPLDEKGKRDARKIGEELKGKIDCMYVSDLRRTKETAEEIQKVSGIPINEIAFWLRPWHLGKFTGKPVEECIAEIKDFAQNKPLTVVPDGESFHDFKNRFLDGIRNLTYEGKKIGLVTHHRNDRLFAAWEKAGKTGKLDLSAMFEKGIKPGTWRREGEQISAKGDIP